MDSQFRPAAPASDSPNHRSTYLLTWSRNDENTTLITSQTGTGLIREGFRLHFALPKLLAETKYALLYEDSCPSVKDRHFLGDRHKGTLVCPEPAWSCTRSSRALRSRERRPLDLTIHAVNHSVASNYHFRSTIARFPNLTVPARASDSNVST